MMVRPLFGRMNRKRMAVVMIFRLLKTYVALVWSVMLKGYTWCWRCEMDERRGIDWQIDSRDREGIQTGRQTDREIDIADRHRKIIHTWKVGGPRIAMA